MITIMIAIIAAFIAWMLIPKKAAPAAGPVIGSPQPIYQPSQPVPASPLEQSSQVGPFELAMREKQAAITAALAAKSRAKWTRDALAEAKELIESDE